MLQLSQWFKNAFPIERSEYVKFFLLASICFLVCTNYTLLRTIRETLVITKPEMGIQIIPFLQTWMLMPITLFFVKMYAFLSARYKQSKVCYCLVGFFLAFYLLFTFIFYPYEAFFRLDRLGDLILSWHIPFSEELGTMFRYWIVSLYYCLSEVWGILVVLILFWGVSNRSNSVEEAKRFYSPILLITNLSGLLASQISLFFSKSSFKEALFGDQNMWGATLLSITLCVCFFTAVILFLFYLFFQRFATDSTQGTLQREDSLTKKEMTLTHLLRMMIQNKMFFLLSMMVFSYFFTSAMMEMVWKYHVQQLYPNSNDFNDYLSRCTLYISVVSVFLALGVTGNFIQKFSWKMNALITPLILFIPLFFLILSTFYGDVDPYYQAFFGALYYCLNRICKFTFFDLSKEIATVECLASNQIKIKTVIDGIVPKFAKTSQSILLQLFLVFFHSFALMIPTILILVLAAHLLWTYSIAEIKIKSFVSERSL